MPTKVWVPTAYQAASKSTIYFMSATHRGDMYHVRASMLMVPRALFLYDCSPASGDLIEYLVQTARDKNMPYFLVPWSRQEVMGPGRPTVSGGCAIGIPAIGSTPYASVALDINTLAARALGFITEDDATRRFTAAVAQSNGAVPFASIPALMSDVKGNEGDLATKFAALKFNWLKPDPQSPIVLVLHRDTGKRVGSAYPELDSGAALPQLLDLVANVRGAPPASGSGTAMHLRAIICGDTPGTSSVPSLGAYWTQLPTVKGCTKRDIEAYFLRWAFTTGKFNMVVGFRSGVTDLFTFMGIPTVSIGLRNLVGEQRHAMLASPVYHRVNVQYDQPRHFTTAWVAGKGDWPNVITSPYWLDPPPAGVTAPRKVNPSDEEKKEWQGKETGPFAPFDTWTVELGLRMACERSFGTAGWGVTVGHIVPFDGCVVTTREGRYGFPLSKAGDGLYDFLNQQSAVDHKDLDWRRTTAGRAQLQESETELQMYYVNPGLNQWNFVHELFSPEFDEITPGDLDDDI